MPIESVRQVEEVKRQGCRQEPEAAENHTSTEEEIIGDQCNRKLKIIGFSEEGSLMT